MIARQQQGRIMKKQLFASLLAGAVLALSGVADAQDVTRFGVAAEPYPPFSSKDASGKWVGFEIDLMDAVCAEMKAKCQLVEVAWDGIIPALQEKKIDVIWSSMSITDERKQVIDFTDKYYNTPSIIIAAKETDIKIDFKNVDSVKGKIFGVQTSTNNANYLQKYFGQVADIKLYDTQDNVNADLVAGRIDLVMADKIALDSFLKSDQGKGFEVKATAPYDPVLGEGIGGGIRKDDAALKDKLNAAIKAVRDNGTYGTIAKKYFDFDIYGSSS
jgi:polar amino acid transport system substrate-binding protein